ncbi:hypothetical protein BRADI_1g52136v3 [Brachypodium distachyon]|uniref:Secreted protein n=1 Tax=Brachypodium distachyon TaxID=15368 RepID=A0A2K2DR18_BRADI|nr:hypothetical protein BRADI_1g52136v3 [Brachypodium distachyon]
MQVAGLITALASLVLLVLHLACCMMGQPAPRDELNDPLIDQQAVLNNQEEPTNPDLPNNQEEPADVPNNQEEPVDPHLPRNHTAPTLDEIDVEDPVAHRGAQQQEGEEGEQRPDRGSQAQDRLMCVDGLAAGKENCHATDPDERGVDRRRGERCGGVALVELRK